MAQTTAERLARYTDEQLAYHEAGHAVVHYLQGGTVTRLSIERTDPRPGTHLGPQAPPSEASDPREALRERIAVAVAGEVAATLQGVPTEIVTAGGKVDREGALRLAAEAGVDDAQARAMMEEEWTRVRALLEEPEHWKLVRAAAEQLVREKVLVADLFRATIAP